MKEINDEVNQVRRLANLASFAETGFMSASKFSRLNAQGLKSLPPITILLHQDRPVGVVVEYSRYLRMQDGK
jgi:hypothetical protein